MFMALICAAGLALAAPAPAPAGDAPASAQGASSTHSAFEGLSALPETDLGRLRAGQEGVYAAVTTQTLNALDGGNTINAGQVNTGGVSLQSGAFAGFSGLGNFVINTGNNNVLQGSLAVTLNIVPASAR